MSLYNNEEINKHMFTLEIKEFPFSQATLRAFYKQKALKFHPDVSQAETEEEMKKINLAYSTLSTYAQADYKEYKEVEVSETDIFKLWEPCKICFGRGYNLKEVPSVEYCPDCESIKLSNWFEFFDQFYRGRGRGYSYKSCPLCTQGKTSSNKECNRCAGTGRIKVVCSSCNGKGIKRNREQYIKECCINCSGKGRIEIKPFNPVIRKGAVLK